MKAREFEIVRDGDFDGVAKALLADKTPVRFVRRRAFNPATTDDNLSDIAARGLFESDAQLKTHNKEVATFAANVFGLAVLWLIFAALIISLILLTVNGVNIGKDGVLSLIILYAALPLTGSAAALLTAFFVCRGRYIKRTFYYLDDLYWVYDKSGNPCAVEIRGKRVRVLYGGTLYTVQGGKVKTTRKPLEIYRASLNMYAPAALDIKNFVRGLAPVNRENSREWGEVAGSAFIGDTRVNLCLNVRRSGLHNVAVRAWGVHKILYELDTHFTLKRVYSAASESFWINYRYVTLAEAVDCGNEVLRELRDKMNDFPQAQKILNGIDL